MTIHYFDPSAWIKRLFREVGTDVVNDLFKTIKAAACCRLGLVEMIATVTRKAFGVSLEARVTQSLIENVRDDCAKFLVVPADESRINEAIRLAACHRLRTMDAIHLGCALSFSDRTVLISSDLELLAAACQEGLSTIDPGVMPGVLNAGL